MSFRFNNILGNNNRVTVAAKAQVNSLNRGSVLAWVFPYSVAVNYNFVFHKGLNTTGKFFAMNTATSLYGMAGRTGGNNLNLATVPNMLNHWNFIVWTFDLNLNPTSKIYHGTGAAPPKEYATAGAQASGLSVDESPYDISWGGVPNPPATGDAVNGLMAACGYWDRPLPYSEIVQQWGHMQPTTGCVDFHVFRNTGRLEQLPDLSYLRRGNPGVPSTSNLLIAGTPKHPSEPAQEIF